MVTGGTSFQIKLVKDEKIIRPKSSRSYNAKVNKQNVKDLKNQKKRPN